MALMSAKSSITAPEPITEPVKQPQEEATDDEK